MKRSLALMLTTLALGAGVADAARRSGGGFGGSRSSGGYSAPRSTPRTTTPRYTPPRNTSSGNSYTAPRTSTPARTPSSTQRSTTSTGATSAANRAAAARVTPSQLNSWKSVKLPAGVPRSAITYSATKNAQYPYQLSSGRYYPYPQSYYRSHGIGSDILKYALIFTAVSSVANALDGPDVIVNGGMPGTVVTQQRGPNLWTYVGVAFLAAAAGWFLLGRRRG
ncbi:hypothetical protein DEIPH_ctg030orf0022 [Deinococcus phoenicis]|uniref:Uncharacterized protein n=1 Tax=Deinococcus phoenicis TaxID=1476583 RepID=A0A016QPC3_9DEIO|nr:hypothetical protein [Deinococcus phoenicis]EYB67985.1 hypothetical protein DEIPH_ctg030orf0022 [Deinococcus phoenicis]